MYYDLHMHSALSPCAENEMTPNNICNMAIIKGLELIAVTDHNSVKQLPAFSKCVEQMGIKALYGAEIQTAEEVQGNVIMEKDCERFDFTVTDEYEGYRIDKLRSELIDSHSRTYIKKLIDDKKVFTLGELLPESFSADSIQ